MKSMQVKTLVLCALFAALFAVCAQISIPVGPVPVTLSLLSVLLCAALMKKQHAALAMAVYMLMGVVGLPVFSGLTGGPGRLFGATGGYIIGYIPCAFLTSLIIEKWGRAYWKQGLAMALGVAVCYAFGTAWFMMIRRMGLRESLTLCVIPFLPGDALKILLAAFLSLRLDKPLRKALAQA